MNTHDIVVALMWAAGGAATLFGLGGVAYYGVGLAKLALSDRRARHGHPAHRGA